MNYWILGFVIFGLFLFSVFGFLLVLWIDLYLWKFHKICWIHDWQYYEIKDGNSVLYADRECKRCNIGTEEYFKGDPDA